MLHTFANEEKAIAIKNLARLKNNKPQGIQYEKNTKKKQPVQKLSKRINGQKRRQYAAFDS